MGSDTREVETEELLERLRSAEAQLSEIERIARVGRWDWDPRTDELIWSESLYRIMGVGEGFVPTLRSYLSIVHPEDRGRTERAVRRSLATGADYTVMHRILIEGSSPVMLLCRGSVELDAAGAPIRLAGVSFDFTDLQPSAEVHRAKHDQLETAEELAGVGSFAWDIETDRLSLSENLHRIFGVGIGQFGGNYDAYMALVHPDDRTDRHQLVERLLAEGDTATGDYRIVRPTGEVRRVQSRILLSRGDDGRPVRLIGAIRDLTDWPDAG